jgi:hypothetical protein
VAKVRDQEYTYLSDRDIAGTALGTSPAGVAAFSDLQRAVYEDQPQDTQEALDSAVAADDKAVAAQGAADSAQASADDAGARADTAKSRADAAYALAAGKVTKANVTAPPNYAGTASITYTQAEVQALMDRVGSLTTTVQAIAAALKV